MKRILTVLVMVSWLFLAAFQASAQQVFFHPQLLTYAGESFEGLQDPKYMTYDSALREYMVKRIHQRFGIELDSKQYSGFDLLEIEALFECKKASEPFEMFLGMFPRGR